MKIKSYFLEIRNRLFLLSLMWLTVLSVCYSFKEILLYIIIKQSICFKESLYFIFTDVAEIFYVYLSLTFFIGNQVLLIYFFYHIFLFFSSGLFYSEYSYLVFIFKISLTLFSFSVFLYNTIFFPFCLKFFLSFQNFEGIQWTTLYFESKISEYLSFYITFYYVCIFHFQILIILFVIFDFSKTTKKLLKNNRKMFYYFFVFLSTLVTPPDVFSQLFLSICLSFSYEVLVFYFLYKKALINSFN